MKNNDWLRLTEELSDRSNFFLVQPQLIQERNRHENVWLCRTKPMVCLTQNQQLHYLMHLTSEVYNPCFGAIIAFQVSRRYSYPGHIRMHQQDTKYMFYHLQMWFDIQCFIIKHFILHCPLLIKSPKTHYEIKPKQTEHEDRQASNLNRRKGWQL